MSLNVEGLLGMQNAKRLVCVKQFCMNFPTIAKFEVDFIDRYIYLSEWPRKSWVIWASAQKTPTSE